MEGFDCPTCNRGEIVMAKGPGRRMRYRHIPDLEIPEELELPTCSACGERWLDADATRRLECALESAYRTALARKAEQAIEALRPHVAQRELERLLGVSAGLLSKLKNGKETSGPMVAVLMLLAEKPHRVEALQRLWALAPEQAVIGPLRIRRSEEPLLSNLFKEVPKASAIQKIHYSVDEEASPEFVRLVA
jgi:transcriptional regulator with XRE-family HTH domain